MRIRYTDEQIIDYLKQYIEDGVTPATVFAPSVGVTSWTFLNWLRKAGIPIRKAPHSMHDWEAIKAAL